ncbi:MAG: cbb3-type cytochrome c oxidase subunit I, partial [bacterium]
MHIEKFSYDNKIVRNFAYATVIWSIVGMLVGLWVALLMVFPEWNFGGIPVGGKETIGLTFGRLRPLHTNAVIFAFVGNGIFMGYYYSIQRLLKTRMASDLLGKIHFWGWQLIIVAAAITIPLGMTSGKEYAELEWPIDIA